MKSKKIATMITALMLCSFPHLVNADTIKYTVQSGDSLWKISQKFNTSIYKIASLNSLDVNKYIYVGQTLLIDSPTNHHYIKHTVVKGDTLWKLSIKYSTTIDKIKNANNLSNDMIFIGQVLNIPKNSSSISENISVKTVNYRVVSGDTIWSVSKKFNTSIDTIKKSNFLNADNLMPGQVLTIPVNSTKIVTPVGITMIKRRLNDNYGDIYDWDNGRRLFTVGTKGTLKDLKTGICFNIKYYGGSHHADIVPLTKSDTYQMKKIFPVWSWEYKRPMVLYFNQGNKNYQLAVSLIGMPHSTTDIYDNGVNGHFCMYFYNSTSHKTNQIDSVSQKNILIANGQ
ncbi:putative peptidoglycan endopeptidase LytE precursor [Clostridium tepidiprofundi DSM 19306]|uniref:Putative peptidoglycan endopeptidase LytE n=1 Tax=Clostridium tepidiprofundi DSM 19306 TaxID=1121338 RepID=A0A151B8N9_9CLOT|nr:LysM peptidoglycan-binding domain-containing protein [Clostridium tepidiprofundi]KYH36007.1 putative peptidoglycan endopeptidase LytE precursor [Clostridium tepidiprofundi DSM 19306]